MAADLRGWHRRGGGVAIGPCRATLPGTASRIVIEGRGCKRARPRMRVCARARARVVSPRRPCNDRPPRTLCGAAIANRGASVRSAARTALPTLGAPVTAGFAGGASKKKKKKKKKKKTLRGKPVP
eukprot:NODE_7987_length_1532_cov_8.254093.p3 GENE.NODE_7987_length_1532_cov_8.254093~~NODE_7987_length_1532_cov_8.254093.p3  ORF type:complete len:126 (+),score=36.49 NODE_7987_length_1532_cov_8.254093:1010-1387(+)